ncbi:MAG: hypothetical protein KZQ92_08165 [Candidatus Thiodiazotropha sp. (ex Lucinoma borealis)]|nr:hypothetical protein [Candidatus Thiodiazotropha sp. (ex Lucinoma borealis)]
MTTASNGWGLFSDEQIVITAKNQTVKICINAPNERLRVMEELLEET